ncbi:hypothetical protein CEXT_381321 [Caerostris extrusa]|uniref:Uncharacterized protein n=1 Tax=Caerostris extrusa TaxID=172846 RepID=A0AAV4UQY5_CAEEX|nr:hypothetical protein CEXT_381321 [Caerostris extrusa]
MQTKRADDRKIRMEINFYKAIMQIKEEDREIRMEIIVSNLYTRQLRKQREQRIEKFEWKSLYLTSTQGNYANKESRG